MTVSDVLFDAAEDIREWMDSFPHYYISVKPELEMLLIDMDHIRRRLNYALPEEEIPASPLSTTDHPK